MTALASGADRLRPYAVPPPCLPPLRSYGLGIGILLHLVSFVCNLVAVLPVVVFLGVLGIIGRPVRGGMLA